MQRTAFVLVATVVGVLAVLVTAEFALRATGFGVSGGAQRSLHELRLDRPWIYGLRPGARVTLPYTGDIVYEVNADGFRDRMRAREPGDHFRIVSIGASVTFGFGVEADQTFPRQLEKALASRAVGPVEVLNLGVSGYNAYNQAAMLIDRGLRYRPDLVLVEFCVAGLHDPALHFDAQTRLHFGMIPAEAFPSPEMRREPPPLAGFLLACRRSRVCSLLDDAYLAAFDQKPDLQQQLYELRPRELPPGPERRWLRARYSEMAEAGRSVGARFAVVAFPYETQIYAAGSGRLQEQVVELSGEEDWPALDLVPAFRRAAAEGAPPLMVDVWHPSSAGHRVAAEATARWLEREHLLSRQDGLGPGSAAPNGVDGADGASGPGTRRAPPAASP